MSRKGLTAVVVARLVAVIALPVACVPRAVSAARAARLLPGWVFQAAATAIWCLWSLRRLWVAVISRHSESAADRPRRWNWFSVWGGASLPRDWVVGGGGLFTLRRHGRVHN